MGRWSLVWRYGAMARIAIFALSIVGAALAEVVSSGAQAPAPSSTVELAVTPPEQSNQQAAAPATATAEQPSASPATSASSSRIHTAIAPTPAAGAADQTITAAIPPPEAQQPPLDSIGPARAAFDSK